MHCFEYAIMDAFPKAVASVAVAHVNVGLVHAPQLRKTYHLIQW